jgi:hypothetical protein
MKHEPLLKQTTAIASNVMIEKLRKTHRYVWIGPFYLIACRLETERALRVIQTVQNAVTTTLLTNLESRAEVHFVGEDAVIWGNMRK